MMREFCLRGFKISVLFIVSLSLLHCARSPIRSPEKSLRVQEAPRIIEDDLGLQSFLEGLRSHIESLQKLDSDRVMIFGPQEIVLKDYLSELQTLLRTLITIKSEKGEVGSKWLDVIKSHFVFMEIYGDEKWGEAFITGYYNPVIPGSLKRTRKFSQPLYGVPDDLVYVDLSAFAEKFPKYQPILDVASEKRASVSLLRGRLEKVKNRKTRIIPYYDRRQIDMGKKLLGRHLELIWVDPLEAFFLQIQGSGTVQWKDRKGQIQHATFGYAAQNGHPYVPIGKFLLDDIPLEKMSMQAIKDHLRSLSRKEAQNILDQNPSYVFFEQIKGLPKTYMGAPVVPERTIATDTAFFPKGAMGFLSFKKPSWRENILLEESHWTPVSRFVFDQDTGGAIRGPHRVDLYWGFGEKAARYAGIMRHKGTLHYLFPKSALKKEK